MNAFSFRKTIGWRLLISLMVAAVALAAAFATDGFALNPKIANIWQGYHFGDEPHRMRQINLPVEFGVTMIVESAKDRKTLVRLDDHTANWYFDDIGYVFFGQLYTGFFGPLTAHDLAWFHNALFLSGLIAIAAGVAFLFSSLVIGLAVIPPLLVVHRLFEGFAYNSVSNHSLIVPAVAVFVACLLLLAGLLRAEPARRALTWRAGPLIAAGALAGAMLLFRHPVGLGAILTLMLLVILANAPWRQRALMAGACLAGYLLVVNVLPGVAQIQRDSIMKWKRPSLMAYFKGPPKHAPNFTLLASVGRYPNSLGLVIIDRAVDDLLVARKRAEPGRWPGEYDAVFDRIARDVLLQYIREHPGEFLVHRLRGMAELFAVLPAVTFQTRDNFAGSPWTTPKTEPLVDDYDRRDHQPDQVINVRLAYVDATPMQWTAYGCAIAALAGGLALAWRRRRCDRSGAVTAYWTLLALTCLYAIARGLIPWWGQDFVLMFWLTALYSGAMITALFLRKVLGADPPPSGDPSITKSL